MSAERREPEMAPPESGSVLEEARRQMVVCNACRYCEGLCAVFPAMERRTLFSDGDLTQLANLCHDCRGCYHACQYVPPHEYAIDVPRVLARLRLETYRDAAWPRALGSLFERPGRALGTAAVIAAGVVLLIVSLLAPTGRLLSAHSGQGAFYEVVPYPLMVWPATALGLYALLALAVGALRFWKATGGGPIPVGALAGATVNALRLTYLGEHAPACDMPGSARSTTRRRLHHLVFYGFGLTLASTSVAALYHHVLAREAPYPLLSLPVILGTVGGVALVIGTAGLLALKRSPDGTVVDDRTRRMDVAFLVLLNLTGLTGLVLLALRATPAMGTLLAVHLGLVAGLFACLPFTKMVHGIYRYLALVRDAYEQEGS